MIQMFVFLPNQVKADFDLSVADEIRERARLREPMRITAFQIAFGVEQQKGMLLAGDNKMSGQIKMREQRHQMQRFGIVTGKTRAVVRQHRVKVQPDVLHVRAAQSHAPTPHVFDNACFANRNARCDRADAARQMDDGMGSRQTAVGLKRPIKRAPFFDRKKARQIFDDGASGMQRLAKLTCTVFPHPVFCLGGAPQCKEAGASDDSSSASPLHTRHSRKGGKYSDAAGGSGGGTTESPSIVSSLADMRWRAVTRSMPRWALRRASRTPNTVTNLVARHTNFAIAVRERGAGGALRVSAAPVNGARHWTHCVLSYALLAPHSGQTRSKRDMAITYFTTKVFGGASMCS